MLIYEQIVNEIFFQKSATKMKKCEKMKIIFKKRHFLWKLYKIFKIFKRTFLHKKYSKNVLTNHFLCAKIGNVKVFFINIGDNFHNFHINLTKLAKK